MSVNLKENIDRILRTLDGANMTIEYWDGQRVSYGTGEPEFLLRIKEPSAVKKILANVLVGLPEAYVDGDVEVEGDLQRLLRLCYANDQTPFRFGALQKLLLAVETVRERNSITGARRNVSHHYDVGNEFYKLWLDERMVYSCAYFERPDYDLDTAQLQKLEHICTKLRLEEGQRLLDIGCGWGALIIHAAENHDVKAVGITLSEEQHELCKARIRQYELQGRVEARLQDYRHLGGETFDRIASVGMIEHVGQLYLRTYMRTAAKALRRGGVGLFQIISQTTQKAVSPWIARHIFPGMYLPTIGELSNEMALAGLRITDVENLRPHYAMTIDHWARRFEKNVETIRGMFDERFVRMWRMYLNSACAAFKYGDLNLWQITFTKGFTEDVPLTRRYMYATAPHLAGSPA
jgi:cyclopropane-fatty-acyl-phospholipid synthase